MSLDALEFYVSHADEIREAAESCPVDAVVVRYDGGGVLGDPNPPKSGPAGRPRAHQRWRLAVISFGILAALIALLLIR